MWGDRAPLAGLSSSQGRKERDGTGQGTRGKGQGREREHNAKRRTEADNGKTGEKESKAMDQSCFVGHFMLSAHPMGGPPRRPMIISASHLLPVREPGTSQRGVAGHNQEDLEADQHEAAGPSGAPRRR